jgi:hypothetical protein
MIKNMTDVESKLGVRDRVDEEERSTDAKSAEEIYEDDDSAVSRATRWKEKIRRKGQELTSSLLFTTKPKEEEETKPGDGIWC